MAQAALPIASWSLHRLPASACLAKVLICSSADWVQLVAALGLEWGQPPPDSLLSDVTSRPRLQPHVCLGNMRTSAALGGCASTRPHSAAGRTASWPGTLARLPRACQKTSHVSVWGPDPAFLWPPLAAPLLAGLARGMIGPRPCLFLPPFGSACIGWCRKPGHRLQSDAHAALCCRFASISASWPRQGHDRLQDLQGLDTPQGGSVNAAHHAPGFLCTDSWTGKKGSFNTHAKCNGSCAGMSVMRA